MLVCYWVTCKNFCNLISVSMRLEWFWETTSRKVPSGLRLANPSPSMPPGPPAPACPSVKRQPPACSPRLEDLTPFPLVPVLTAQPCGSHPLTLEPSSPSPAYFTNTALRYFLF